MEYDVQKTYRCCAGVWFSPQFSGGHVYNSLKKKKIKRFICAAHGNIKGENKIIARSS